MAALEWKMVAHYAWKLKYSGGQDIAEVTSAQELEEYLRALQCLVSPRRICDGRGRSIPSGNLYPQRQ